MNINLIGLGKLGYPMSLFLSSSGSKFNCYDNDIEDIKAEIQDLYNKMQDEIE